MLSRSSASEQQARLLWPDTIAVAPCKATRGQRRDMEYLAGFLAVSAVAMLLFKVCAALFRLLHEVHCECQQVLKDVDEAPQLPASYPAMAILVRTQHHKSRCLQSFCFCEDVTADMAADDVRNLMRKLKKALSFKQKYCRSKSHPKVCRCLP